MKRLILIDSHAIIHRAYHALPPLMSSSGEPMGAVYGFTSMLLRILRELKPDYIVAAFDLPGPTFRHVAYERYKAQRPETPSDLSSQFIHVREVLSAFSIRIIEKEGYEADDIIGTVAEKLKKHKDIEVIVVTGDADALQLVRPRLKVYSMKKGISDTVIYDVQAVRERFGFAPAQLIDFKGLKGDPSDNIPGVRGIGEKTAIELIKQFGSIEKMYKLLPKNKTISESVRAKLVAGEEDALFSRELARIKLDVPLSFRLEDVVWHEEGDRQNTRALFQKFGFTSLLKRMEQERIQKSPQNLPGMTSLYSDTSAAGDSEQVIREIRNAKEFSAFVVGTNATEKIGIIFFEQTLFLVKKGGGVAKLHEKLLREKKVADFFSRGVGFAVYDAKSIILLLRRHGVECGEIAFDAMLASYLTESASRDFSYIAVCSRELGRLVSSDPREEFSHFFDVVSSLDGKLNEGRIREVFQNIEMPTARILATLEAQGVRIDTDFLATLSRDAEKKIKKITKDIFSAAGEEFNIQSPQQLSKILFEKLGLQTIGLRKTEKGGVVSTSAAELEKLRHRHPIIENILEFRELAKLKNTYIDVLPKLVDARTGRLYTTFHQTVAATGRLSSSDPNLQNIPIQSLFGREIRKAFVADKGYELVAFDYSQIELRVAAHMADDTKMIEAFQKGLDIHALTAAEIYNVPLGKVTPELRRAAKTLNFGVLYGMGPQAFAEATDMSREDAKKFIDEYFSDFSGVREYITRTKEFASLHGFVETLFGRRRYIPEIQSSNWQLKREAERMAVNMPIQGTATGDIIKLAMIHVDQWVRKEKLQNDVRMLLQVHDELVFEIKKDFFPEAASKIKKIMESVAALKVPLVVEVKSGPNWGAQKKIHTSV